MLFLLYKELSFARGAVSKRNMGFWAMVQYLFQTNYNGLSKNQTSAGPMEKFELSRYEFSRNRLKTKKIM